VPRFNRMLLALALAAASMAICATAQAQYNCQAYLDSRSGSSGGTDFCWLSGSICYDCWDNFYNTCSNDWEPCDPRPQPRTPFVQYAARSPAPSEAGSPAPPSRICAVTHAVSPVRVEILF
jgi:hypothetical protein